MTSSEPKTAVNRRWSLIGPGIVVAATGVGAGDLVATLIAGSRFGYALLFVVVLASLSGMVLQNLCSRLGIATGRDLAQLSAERYSRRVGE